MNLPNYLSRESLLKIDLLGVHLALNIFVATTLLWIILRQGAGTSPIWAISSMIAASDPHVGLAYQTFRARLFNTLLGCTTGMFFLILGGSNEWKLPLCLAVTVLISSYVVRIQTMWRQAPITAAIITASSLKDHTKLSSIEVGGRRVAEVILGCVVGLLVTWVISKLWPVQEVVKVTPAKA